MRNIIQSLVGILNFGFIVINILLHTALMAPLSIIKMLLPIEAVDKRLTKMLDWLGESWISWNKFYFLKTGVTKLTVTGTEGLEQKDWYLCVANHQSWSDVMMIQFALNGKIPFLKFFIKKQLIMLPIVGQIWYAMDFPFMSRYSKATLKKKPHLMGKDIETTKKSCEKFKYKPVSVMNFIEGTRFTWAKHAAQNSPYKYLLKPKAGGIAFVLEALDGHINKLLDITVVYDGPKTFWDFLCRRTRSVHIDVRSFDVDGGFKGNYQTDEIFRRRFQEKISTLWQEKDQRFEEILQ